MSGQLTDAQLGEALRRGFERVSKVAKELGTDFAAAANHVRMQDRRMTARGELLKVWSTMTPADKSWLRGLPPHMQDQWAMAIGLSEDARALAGATLAETGGNIDGLFQQLDHHAQHDAQQSIEAEVRDRTGGGNDALQLQAGIIAEKLGIEPKEGQSYADAVAGHVRSVAEGKIKDPRVSTRSIERLEYKEAAAQLGGRRPTDKAPLGELNEQGKKRVAEEQGRRNPLEQRYAEIDAAPSSGRPAGPALSAAKAAAAPAPVTRNAALSDAWDSMGLGEEDSILPGPSFEPNDNQTVEVANAEE